MSSLAYKLKPEDRSQPKSAPEQNRRILIVEDEPSIAEGIKSIISPKPSNVLNMPKSSRSAPAAVPTEIANEPIKYEVTWAKSPLEAMKYIKSGLDNGKPFAMGFFDVMLGADIDGIELVRRIHEMDPKMYAVFVTAYTDRSVDSIGQVLGSDKSDRWDYLNKPFTDGEILQKAKNFTSLWNLQNLKAWQDEQLAEASKLLLQGERAFTVAAVGRSVAHEFGNLMTQIVGHAELALMKEDKDRMKLALETILKASDTASSILEKFKKMTTGGDGSVEKGLLLVNRSLDEAVELMAHEFKKSQIKITKIKNDQVLIEANHHSLVQVFMNVFINAAYVMKDGGQIDLSIQKIDKDWMEIRVRDYGPGIPEDIIHKVIEPLFTTKGAQGSGLGLAICKEIIEIEHRGTFTVKNHMAKGLEITMKLPTRQEVVDG